MKRFLAVTLGLIFCLLPALGQQNSDSPKKSDKEQKTKKEDKQPAAQKTPEAPAAPEQKTEPAKEAEDKDKEPHFDVSEVAPVVTHHQITVNGLVLKYTATAGRLPLKRADGKIEAEMFFVAYTLDGADAAKRPL